jgi:hypothetical protein
MSLGVSQRRLAAQLGFDPATIASERPASTSLLVKAEGDSISPSLNEA